MITILKTNGKIKHLIKYGIFGILTTIVSFGTFSILRKIFSNVNENLLNTISIIAAIIFSYITNRKYVFKSKETNIFKEFYKFVSSRMISAFFEIIMFYIFTSLLFIDGLISKIIISLFVIILNYITSKVFVFKFENKHEN